jgi:hypothetical protein
LPGKNTLAYYRNPQITAVNCFIVQAAGPNDKKITAVVYECSQ